MPRPLVASATLVLLATTLVFVLTQRTAHAATITVDTLVDAVAADGDCSLREAILNAEDAVDGHPHADCDAGNPAGEDTIDFSVSGTITLAALSFPAPGQPLTQDLVIDGGGDIELDAHDAGRFFIVDGTELTLIGLEFHNGVHLAEAGGSIRVDGGTLNIIDSAFVSSGTTQSGGAIMVDSGTLNVSGSTFTGNSANDDGGAICAVGGSSVTISDSTFVENEAGGDAGAVCASDGTLAIEDTSFILNVATRGGAIATAAAFGITGGEFFSNIASNQGGAVWATALEITGTTFEANQAGDEGGGIYAGTDEEVGSEGGAMVAVNGPAILTDVTLRDNQGTGAGAYFNNNATLSDMLVVGNAGSGIVVAAGVTVAVSDSTFVLNTSSANGGALHAHVGSNVTVSGSTFTQNSAVSGGGAISSGGALTIDASEFAANVTPNFGGALSIGGSVSIATSLFTGNSGNDGGAIFSESAGPISIVDSTFAGNDATDGGAIHNLAGVHDIERSTFADNTATGNGGAIFNDSIVELVNSTLSGNSADGDGGGLWNEAESETTLLNVTMFGNSATQGGGYYVDATSSLDITNSVIASSIGGDSCVSAGDVTGVQGSNVSDDASCPAGLFEQVDDVELGPLGDNGGPTETHLPAADSPLVDAGNNASCPGEDQRGEDRIAGEGCDVGSVEVQDPAAPPPPDQHKLFVPGLASEVGH